jgi:hypothetical protein
MKRCFFNISDGSFVKSVETNHQETIDRNTPPNSVYFDGDYGVGHYVKNGKVTEIPARPSEFHRFDFSLKNWVPCEGSIREKRRTLLEVSDWTDTLSSKERLGEQLYTAWMVYRQALRDIPEQPGFPVAVQWPVAPI